MKQHIDHIDHRIARLFKRYGHYTHRVSLGLLFVWFGSLKIVGRKTATSIIAHTIYWGSPEDIIPLLGSLELSIGLCLLIRPLARAAILMLLIRLPGSIVALLILPDVCWHEFPFAPTIAGQYLIKDITIFFAAIAIAGSVREKSDSEILH
ncbi:MAG: hypothetical protein CMF59_08110 [Leptospiraceae bacterium]|nr:hypothetical protein [Leptospiraceae bacterium]